MKYETSKQEKISELVENNVGFLLVIYSGGGDSGAIDEIQLVSSDCKHAHEQFHANALETTWSKEFNLSAYESDVNFIEDIAYGHLNNVEDWCNNDGGFGSMLIELPSLRFINLNTVQYTETDSYNHSGVLEL